MTDSFLEKFRVLAGLTKQFEFEPVEEPLTESTAVATPQVLGFAAEEKISKHIHSSAVKSLAATLGDKHPIGDYWHSSAVLEVTDGVRIYAGMGVSYYPRPDVLACSWSAEPGMRGDKNQAAVDAMIAGLKKWESVLKKYGEVKSNYDSSGQYARVVVEIPVPRADEYIGDLDDLAKRFGKLVLEAAAKVKKMESVEIPAAQVMFEDVTGPVAQRMLLLIRPNKALSEAKLDERRTYYQPKHKHKKGVSYIPLKGTRRRHKDGSMWILNNMGRWVKQKKNTARLKAGNKKHAALHAAQKKWAHYYDENENSGSIAERMETLLEGWGDMLGILQDLRAGDKVEITYHDSQKGGRTSTTRVVEKSWEDLKNDAPGSFKDVMVQLKAKVAGKMKAGMIRDYGNGRILWQPTMSTKVTDVLDLKKL